MTDTIWADVSEFQRTVDDTYPHRVFAFRCNDGTYVDAHFRSNLAWARAAADRGDLDVFIVYGVYEPDGGAWASTLMDAIGTPHPKLAVMIDAESWGGRIGGDHSADLNAGRRRITDWIGGNSAAVLAYGNAYDLNDIWPDRGDAWVVLAAYGSNPSYPRKIAHQYTANGTCAPFGHPVDLNSADGLTPTQFADRLGLGTSPGKDDDTMILNIEGKAGERRGGLYLVQGGRATFIGARSAEHPGDFPMFTDEDEIAALQAEIPGLR